MQLGSLRKKNSPFKLFMKMEIYLESIKTINYKLYNTDKYKNTPPHQHFIRAPLGHGRPQQVRDPELKLLPQLPRTSPCQCQLTDGNQEKSDLSSQVPSGLAHPSWRQSVLGKVPAVLGRAHPVLWPKPSGAKLLRQAPV
jgi:hypothetical protein